MREDIRFKVAFANAVSREQNIQLRCCSMARGGTTNQCGQIAFAETSQCTGTTYDIGAKCTAIWDPLARISELCAAPPGPCHVSYCVPTACLLRAYCVPTRCAR